MTTLRQIIADSFREGGIIQIGTMPEAEQLDEGLRKLQNIIVSLLGNEAGENLSAVTYGTGSGSNEFARDHDKQDFIDSYFVPSNVRLLVHPGPPRTVYLDPNPEPGARLAVHDVGGTFATDNFILHGNGRKIDGSTQTVLSTDGENSQWFYRDDLTEWVKVVDLDAGSESPFPTEFDELLITALALRMNPRYQQQTAPETIQAYRQARSRFRTRYRQTEFAPSDVSRLFWNGFSSLDSTTTFNRGLVAKW